VPNYTKGEQDWHKIVGIASALASQEPIAATPGFWAGYQGPPPSVAKPTAASLQNFAAMMAGQPAATAPTTPGGWMTAPSLFGLPRWAIIAAAFGGAYLIFRR